MFPAVGALHFTTSVLMKVSTADKGANGKVARRRTNKLIELKLSRLPGSTSSSLGTTRAATPSTLTLSFLLLVIMNCTLVDVLAGLPGIFPGTYPLDEIL